MWVCCKTVQADHTSSSNIDLPQAATPKNISYGSESSGSSAAGNTPYPISRSVGELNPNPNLNIQQTPKFRYYTFAELKQATHNFRSDTVIGKGLSGNVFKGWIDDNPFIKNGSGYAIAVNTKYEASNRTILSDDVKFFGRLSHTNLVKLLGYCREDKKLLLVNEVMENGSLDCHLFIEGSAVQPLSWNLRLKIVLGAARGLAFLHSSELKSYGGFKASNILLDRNYNAKLSVANNYLGRLTSPIIVGYEAPEYLVKGHWSEKGDVYAFGVVLLEILTGLRVFDRNRPTEQHDLVQWLRPCLSDRKKVMRIMDPRLDGQCSSQEAILVAELSLKCLGFKPSARPSLEKIVKSLGKIQAIKESRTSTRHQNTPDRAQLLVATEIIGQSVHKTAKLILEYLMDPMIGVIGIYGMGGIGKTTTMMNINAQRVTTEAFDKIIWVTVSKVLSLDDVQIEIAKQLNLSLPVDVDEVHRASMLSDRLKKLKFLIILDDIWKTILLEKVGIPQPSMENGCKVVLTTRSENVCHSMSTDKNIYIKGLSDEEAWDLFVSKAGDQVLTSFIRPIASKVVGECLSHPLVIITVGHALRECSSLTMWNNALMALRSSKTKIEDPEEVIYKLLRMGYSYLKNHMVQQCFLYCAFFPEDYLFEPNELIRYWMAEGFINEVGDIVSEIREGFKILKELKDASLLHVFKDHLRMHAMFRGLAIDIMREQSGFLFMSGLGLKVLPSDLEWAEGRKIALMRNGINFLDDLPCSCPNLLTLLLTHNPSLYDISPSFFSEMRSLQVLDISYSRIAELPSSVSHLLCLHTLFLQHCTSLREIPSVENLRELRFLNLRGTSIEKLPEGFENLARLRFLDLSETKHLMNIRVGVIWSLWRLEELHLQGSSLCLMDTPRAASSIKEMRYLPNLKVLTLSAVGFGDHLDTIMCLQEQKLVSFNIDMYGSAEDVVDGVNDSAEDVDGVNDM